MECPKKCKYNNKNFLPVCGNNIFDMKNKDHIIQNEKYRICISEEKLKGANDNIMVSKCIVNTLHGKERFNINKISENCGNLLNKFK